MRASSEFVAAGGDAGEVRRTLAATSPRYGEKLIKASLAACAAISVAITTGIVLSLVLPSLDFFRAPPVGAADDFVVNPLRRLVDFFTGTVWRPDVTAARFGVWPIVAGTLIVTGIALCVAIPVGMACAIYLSEYAPRRMRKVIKPVLEMLEGIPTVAIGLFAIAFLRPLAEDVLPFLNWTTPQAIGVAGFGVGLLIIPLIASVTDDAMRSVPAHLRQGAYALGASKITVSMRVAFPAAISGIVAAVVLAASRAIGETMIVLLAAGAGSPFLLFGPTDNAGTMTGYIAGKATGDISQGTIGYYSIFAVGTLLFIMTLTMNIGAMRLVRRFREVYD